MFYLLEKANVLGAAVFMWYFLIFYFGKEIMNLHCDIFFKKKKDLLVKSVYITAMYRCDQDMIARLNIADVLLKDYK